MSAPTPSTGRPRRTTRPAAAASLLLGLLGLLGSLLVAAPAAGFTTALSVDLLGRPLTGGEHQRGTVVGALGGTGAAFTLRAPCATDSATPTSCANLIESGTSLYWHWDFGDGRRRTTTDDTPGGPVTFDTPGVHTVTVTVDNAPAGTRTGQPVTGHATLRVLVAPRFADLRGGAAGEELSAVRATTALRLFDPCGIYRDKATWPGAAGASATDVGQAMFCPTPDPAPYLRPDRSPEARTLTADGVTGADCLSDPAACGLPAEVFATTSVTGSATDCNEACVTELISRGLLDTSRRTIYRPQVCADNWAVGRWATDKRPGAEEGCLTYGEFLTALARALDGGTIAPGADLADGCVTGDTTRPVRRAVLLLTGAPGVDAVPGLLRVCDTGAALTKTEAYALASAATGRPAAATGLVEQLRDLTTAPRLAYGPATTDAFPGRLGALLETGAPLVGDLTCADASLLTDGGVCFNGGQALHRRDGAALLAHLLTDVPSATTRLGVTLTPRRLHGTLGNPVDLRLRIRVPSWYPTTEQVRWTADTGGAGTLTCARTSASVGADRTVAVTCVLTPTSDVSAGAPVTLTVTDDHGATAAATALVYISNTAPTVTVADPGDLIAAEGETVPVTIDAADAEGNPVTLGVRSCDPDREVDCVTDQPTYPRNGDKAPVHTADTDPSGFATTAPTPIGDVTLTTDAAGSTVTLTPHHPDNNGEADFVVQACDSGNACTTEYVRATVHAANDVPAPADLATVDVDAAGTTLTLTGTDTADTGQPGAPGGNPITGWRLCTIPDGWTTQWVAGTEHTDAVEGLASDVGTLHLRPGRATPTGTYTFTYQVRDRGHATPTNTRVWSAASCADAEGTGQLSVNNTASPDTTLSVTRSPATATAFTDDVTVSVTGLGHDEQILIEWGDGTSTGPVTGPQHTHRYTADTDTSYRIRYRLRDADGTVTDSVLLPAVEVLANHLTHPTLESGTAPWATTGSSVPATAGITTARAHHGTRSLLVETDELADPAAPPAQCVVATTAGAVAGYTVAGNSYTATGWVWLPDPDQAAQAALVEVDADGVETMRTTRSVTTGTGDWVKVTVPHTAAADGSTLRLELSADQPADTRRCLFLDDVAVTGPMAADSTYAATVAADEPVAYAATTSEPTDAETTVAALGPAARRATVTATRRTGTWRTATLAASGAGLTTVAGGTGLADADRRADADRALASGRRVRVPAGGATVEAWVTLRPGRTGTLARVGTAAREPVRWQLTEDRSGAALRLGSHHATLDGAGTGAVHLVATLEADRVRMWANGAELDVTGPGAGPALRWMQLSTRDRVSSLRDVAVYAAALPEDRIRAHHLAGAPAADAALAEDTPVPAGSVPATRPRADGALTVETLLRAADRGPLWRLAGHTARIRHTADGGRRLLVRDRGTGRRWAATLPSTSRIAVTVSDGTPPTLVRDGVPAPLDRQHTPASAATAAGEGTGSTGEPEAAGAAAPRATTARATAPGWVADPARSWVFATAVDPLRLQHHYTAAQPEHRLASRRRPGQ